MSCFIIWLQRKPKWKEVTKKSFKLKKKMLGEEDILEAQQYNHSP